MTLLTKVRDVDKGTRELCSLGQVPSLFPLSAWPGLFMVRADYARESYKCLITVLFGLRDRSCFF